VAGGCKWLGKEDVCIIIPTTAAPTTTTVPATTQAPIDKSATTCNEFQWRPRQLHVPAEQGVCGQSVINGACHEAVTQAAANMVCTSVGARLCSVDELLADATRGTGCGYDSLGLPVWSLDVDTDLCGGDGTIVHGACF
jgi:hypothetical protein